MGLRPRYYSDNNEDALIMTTESFGSPALEARIARLRAAIDDGPAPVGPFEPDQPSDTEPDLRPGRDEPPREAGR